MPSLYEITQSTLYLQELLESGEIEEQVYLDSVEGLCAEGKIDDICKVLKNLEHKALAYKTEADRMTERRRTIENNMQRLKDSLLLYMKATNSKKVDAGLFTVSVRNSKSVNIRDVYSIPLKYLVAQDPKVDKAAISKALKDGETVEGAELVENQSINIR